MKLTDIAIALVLAVFALVAGAEDSGHGHSRHGNPPDLERYLRSLMDPGRDAWQQPRRVVAALGLGAGDTACDIGAGPGYFTLRLSRAVGATGRIYAVDVVPVILDKLRGNLAETDTGNVTPVLGLSNDPLLPAGACDVILIVNTYHHFPDGPGYLRRLREALGPGGRLVNIDFRAGSPLGPPHKIPREIFLRQAGLAGYEHVGEENFLEHQYFIVLRPAT